MPKHVLIARHAKSSHDNPNLSDYERPLNHRGLSDAPEMGKHLVQNHCVPRLVLTSSAMRARQTAELMVESFGNPPGVKLEYVEEFYHAPPDVYLQRLANLPDSFDAWVMVVGHNPGLEQLINQLSDHFVPVPTCAVAFVQFDTVRWSSISIENGRLESLWTPK